jgi:hypothetical protein
MGLTSEVLQAMRNGNRKTYAQVVAVLMPYMRQRICNLFTFP